MGLRQLNNGGFSSYDPDNYDPTINRKYNNVDGDGGNAGYATTIARPGQKMQVNLILNNPTDQVITFEMFSFLDSFTRRRKQDYIPADTNYAYYPLSSFEGMNRVVDGLGGIVGFNAAGDLIITGEWSGSGTQDPIATIACGEIPYACFFEASGIIPFQVAFFRLTVTTDDQIDKNIVYFKKSYSGGTNENTINPRAYFRPNQFQNKTIDITVSFPIGIDTGLRTDLLAGESTRYAMFIQVWTGQTVLQDN